MEFEMCLYYLVLLTASDAISYVLGTSSAFRRLFKLLLACFEQQLQLF